ncbi:MAG TPA: hypothetical protein EYP40_11395 [Chromatiales bacterium]|nr:hypothetical protein [Chromatiales bacterium]
MYTRRLVYLFLAGLGAAVMPMPAYSESETLPMPPRFTQNALPATVLLAYPLGMIDHQAAFSHHGSAHRRLTMPNGNEGWVFNIGDKEWHRTYTLVFKQDGTVGDVLYHDHSRYSETGLSALLLQSKGRIVDGPRTAPGPD